MEMGLGFAIGAAVGAGIGFLIVMIVHGLRQSARQAPARTAGGPAETPPAPPSAGSSRRVVPPPQPPPVPGAAPQRFDREAKLYEVMGEKENKLGKAVHEVRDLVLKVADIVNRTNDASGQAAKAFHSAKSNLDAINLGDGDSLLAAHAILLGEINSVIATNEKLQSELDSARTGIAEQRRQIEELRTAVRIDGLTQLPNRAAFDERLTEFLKRLERTDEVFSLLLLDIDFFKNINDTHGHVNGDRILRGIAMKIKDNVRTNDLPARYGGEEFAVILPDTEPETAMTVAERMRQDISKTVFKLDGNSIRATISGGLARSVKGQKPEQLIAEADAALYQSKANGRNMITLRNG